MDVEALASSLEPVVDKEGIAKVLEALCHLAAAKAHHVDTTWGDRELSRSWARVALRVDKVASFAREERL